MFCSKCGKEIDDQAVICTGCGVPTANFQAQQPAQPPSSAQPIIITNTNTAVAQSGRIRRKRSVIFDIFMIFITGGLWIIWMVLRPKYY